MQLPAEHCRELAEPSRQADTENTMHACIPATLHFLKLDLHQLNHVTGAKAILSHGQVLAMQRLRILLWLKGVMTQVKPAMHPCIFSWTHTNITCCTGELLEDIVQASKHAENVLNLFRAFPSFKRTTGSDRLKLRQKRNRFDACSCSLHAPDTLGFASKVLTGAAATQPVQVQPCFTRTPGTLPTHAADVPLLSGAFKKARLALGS